jgi:hypothetical protein
MEKIIGRLQTPQDSNGERKDIHPITDADAVLIDENSTLTDYIEKNGLGIQMQEEQPTSACFWIKPLSTES